MTRSSSRVSCCSPRLAHSLSRQGACQSVLWLAECLPLPLQVARADAQPPRAQVHVLSWPAPVRTVNVSCGLSATPGPEAAQRRGRQHVLHLRAVQQGAPHVVGHRTAHAEHKGAAVPCAPALGAVVHGAPEARPTRGAHRSCQGQRARAGRVEEAPAPVPPGSGSGIQLAARAVCGRRTALWSIWPAAR